MSGHEKESSAIKKGLLWLQRDKLFSRWKERYFILTRDYLACFKKGSKIANSDMGGFINKLNLADVDGVEWMERKGEELIVITVPQEGKLLLKAKSGVHDWLQALRSTIADSKGRREALRNSMGRELRSVICDSGHFEGEKYAVQTTYSDCSPQMMRFSCDITRELRGSTGRLRTPVDHKFTPPSQTNYPRFSLLTDVDVHGDLDDDPGIDLNSTTSSSSTPSKHILVPSLMAGHRRTHSHGPVAPSKLLDNGILYTCTSVETPPNVPSRAAVDRSVSDAHHLEVQARRRMKSDKELNVSTKEMRKRFSGLYLSSSETTNA